MRKRATALHAGLFSLGGVALVAGCSGGAVSRGPGGTTVYVPPVPSAAGKATLTLTIPARSASASRRVKYYSPGSAALGISAYPAGIASPFPAATIFTVPTPGPSPTTTSFALSAPVGNDTFTATLYDANPSASPGANALSTATVNATIVLNASNTVSMTLLGIPRGVLLTASGAGQAWRVLENLSVDQTIGISAQALDADGYAISGALATAAPVSGTGDVTLSATSLTSATANLTATFPHGSSDAGMVTSSLPLNNTQSIALNVAVSPYYYAYVLDNTGGVTVIDPTLMRQVGPTLATGGVAQYIAAPGGCNSGVALVPNGATGAIVDVAAPTGANPAPSPTVTTAPGLFGANGASSSVVTDRSCHAYFVDTTGALTRIAGVPVEPLVNTLGSGYSTGSSLSVVGSNLYVINATSTSLNVATEQIPGGQPVGQPTSFPGNAGLSGGSVVSDGSALYAVNGICVQSPQLFPLAGGPAITIPQVSGSAFEAVFGALGASDGTLYVLDVAEVGSNTETELYYGSAATLASSPSSVNLGNVNANAMAMSPDQQFICVLEANGSAGVAQFYRRSPVPTLVGTIPLPSTPNAVAFGP